MFFLGEGVLVLCRLDSFAGNIISKAMDIPEIMPPAWSSNTLIPVTVGAETLRMD
jgi:hypothetical protein